MSGILAARAGSRPSFVSRGLHFQAVGAGELSPCIFEMTHHAPLDIVVEVNTWPLPRCLVVCLLSIAHLTPKSANVFQALTNARGMCKQGSDMANLINIINKLYEVSERVPRKHLSSAYCCLHVCVCAPVLGPGTLTGLQKQQQPQRQQQVQGAALAHSWHNCTLLVFSYRSGKAVPLPIYPAMAISAHGSLRK